MQNPKPHDLVLGRTKRGLFDLVEVRRGAASRRSSDLGLGVKYQSCAEIAGSPRNETKVQSHRRWFRR